MKLSSTLLAIGISILPIDGTGASTKINENRKIVGGVVSGILLNDIRKDIIREAFSILEGQFCGEKPLEIQYIPLAHNIGVCIDKNRTNYEVSPAKITACGYTGDTSIQCKVETPRGEFCIAIDTESNILSGLIKEPCKK